MGCGSSKHAVATQPNDNAIASPKKGAQNSPPPAAAKANDKPAEKAAPAPAPEANGKQEKPAEEKSAPKTEEKAAPAPAPAPKANNTQENAAADQKQEKTVEEKPAPKAADESAPAPEPENQSAPAPVEEKKEQPSSEEQSNDQQSAAPAAADEPADAKDDVPAGPGVKFPTFLNCVLYPPNKAIMEKYQKEQNDTNEPVKKLQLEFVYGAGVKGVQGNLLYVNSKGDLVYPAAATNVVYSRSTHTQTSIRGHDDDITCIAQHPDRDIFASGQTGRDDYILVWNSVTQEVLTKLDTSNAFNPGGVLDISFNPSDPTQLAVVGGTDHECSVQVWDWKDGKLLASKDLTNDETHALAWSPEGDIVWMGNGGIKFIEFSGNELDPHTGILGDKGVRQRFLSIDFAPNNDVLIGTHSGMLYRFKDRKLISKKRAHKGTTRTIVTTKDGFISGGKDGSIKVWKYSDSEQELAGADDSFDEDEYLDTEADSSQYAIVNTYELGDYTRSVTVNPEETHAFVFESDGDVIELDLSSGETKTLMYGHNGSRNELWGLDVSPVPEKPYVVSAADDGRVLIFNYKTRQLLGQVASKTNKFRGVTFSPDAEQMAVTSHDGDLFILAVDKVANSKLGNVKRIDTSKDTDLEISVVKYSPCGKYLAVGSHDTNIYIYSCEDNFSRVATFDDHSATILGFDWSKDSQHLRSVCAAKELLFWKTGSEFERDEYSENKAGVEWASENCIFTWSTRGMWSADSYNDSSDINGCDVDFNTNHLAFADDKGKLNMARYPTLNESVPVDQYLGHCSHLTRCRFSPDGKYLFSAGGADLCTFQWKVEQK